MKQLETFSVQNYTNITQLHKFQYQKNNLNPGEIIISEDFSDNYWIKHQDEIMSAHYLPLSMDHQVSSKINPMQQI